MKSAFNSEKLNLKSMNQTQANALLATLEAQRNGAMNAVAQAEATNAGLREQIAALEAQVASLKEAQTAASADA